ncbi:FAD binding domain-containing protein [Roseovarius salinarum]|jgi:carbon-monoxide dehydrogenase medium subunit|uniref:FAD binding domain-containing protein n=1 Tax=Roseovarius salinarum TaxID=1981892 RepID=UPI000C328791|nr:xanthine dehydrogenase family protein subunit M [Roseovarius salinarum]
MIPGAFEYYRPQSVPEAVSLLGTHGDDARVVAGGHSLIPMMKLRMADVPHLIDLQGLSDLSGISVEDGQVRLGALVTQSEIVSSDALAQAAPILRETAMLIADPQVRNMGTVGGNVANGDPGNDMPALMQCLDAEFDLVGPGGARAVKARDFYIAAYMTEREDDEILTGMRFAVQTGGWAYEKQKRKIGDYATAAAAVQLTKEGGKVATAAIAMTNLSDVPAFSEAAGAALIGTDCDDAAIKAAVDAMQGDIEPSEDNRGPVEFKRHVAGVMLSRAVKRAWSRA